MMDNTSRNLQDELLKFRTQKLNQSKFFSKNFKNFVSLKHSNREYFLQSYLKNYKILSVLLFYSEIIVR